MRKANKKDVAYISNLYNKKIPIAQKRIYFYTAIFTIVVILFFYLFIPKPQNNSLAIILSVIVLICIMSLIKYYFISRATKIAGGLAIKYVADKVKKGENPYPAPWKFGLGFGILFNIVYLAASLKINHELPVNSWIVYVTLFIAGFVVGYIVQKINYKRLGLE